MAIKGKTWDVHAIGRRKSSVARVYLVEGSGKKKMKCRMP